MISAKQQQTQHQDVSLCFEGSAIFQSLMCQNLAVLFNMMLYFDKNVKIIPGQPSFILEV